MTAALWCHYYLKVPRITLKYPELPQRSTSKYQEVPQESVSADKPAGVSQKPVSPLKTGSPEKQSWEISWRGRRALLMIIQKGEHIVSALPTNM